MLQALASAGGAAMAPRHGVEYAKSERSECKLCGKKIAKGLVRLGFTTRLKGYDTTKWYVLVAFCSRFLIAHFLGLPSWLPIFGSHWSPIFFCIFFRPAPLIPLREFHEWWTMLTMQLLTIAFFEWYFTIEPRMPISRLRWTVVPVLIKRLKCVYFSDFSNVSWIRNLHTCHSSV